MGWGGGAFLLSCVYISEREEKRGKIGNGGRDKGPRQRQGWKRIEEGNWNFLSVVSSPFGFFSCFKGKGDLREG